MSTAREYRYIYDPRPAQTDSPVASSTRGWPVTSTSTILPRSSSNHGRRKNFQRQDSGQPAGSTVEDVIGVGTSLISDVTATDNVEGSPSTNSPSNDSETLRAQQTTETTENTSARASGIASDTESTEEKTDTDETTTKNTSTTTRDDTSTTAADKTSTTTTDKTSTTTTDNTSTTTTDNTSTTTTDKTSTTTTDKTSTTTTDNTSTTTTDSTSTTSSDATSTTSTESLSITSTDSTTTDSNSATATSSETLSSTASSTETTSADALRLTSISMSGSITISYTAVVTTVDGTVTTSYSPLPTSLASPEEKSTSQRTAIIASTTAAALVLILLALAVFFIRTRRNQKKVGFIEALVNHRKKEYGRSMLLHGEDWDDGDLDGTRYSDNPSSASFMRGHQASPSISSLINAPQIQAASSSTNVVPLANLGAGRRQSSDETVNSTNQHLFRSRGSETGSIFHEGGVWPPPGHESKLVDPFKREVSAGSRSDLGSIVDDVMGPGNATHSKGSSGSSPLAAPPLTSLSPPPAVGAAGVEGGLAAAAAAAATAIRRSSVSTGKLTVRNSSGDASDNDAESFQLVSEEDYKEESRDRFGRHERDMSTSSAAGLLDDDPFAAPSTPPRIITIPTSASGGVSRSISSSSNSTYSLPSPTTYSPSKKTVIGLPLGAAQPKFPSPLSHQATAVTPSEEDPFGPGGSMIWRESEANNSSRGSPKLNWLDRSPRNTDRRLSSGHS